jgi:hypothetical protein
VKRYINAYTVLTKVRPNLQPHVLLAIQTIRFRLDWELVWQKLQAYRGNFTAAVARQIGGDQTALATLDPDLAAVPTSFLDYVDPKEVGNALLGVKDLDEYIYAGETRSDSGINLADLLRDITLLRQPLEAAANRSADPAKVRSEVASKISMARRKLESLMSAPTAFGQALMRHLGELERLLNELPSTPSIDEWQPWAAAERTPWLQRIDKTLRLAVADLLQWSRSN